MQRSKLPYFFLGLAAVLAVAAIALLILKPGIPRPSAPAPATDAKETVETPAASPPPGDVSPSRISEDPEVALKDPGEGRATSNPTELVRRIAKSLENADLATTARLIGKTALDPATAADLQAFAAKGPLRIKGVREVGEMELNKSVRWALELDGAAPGQDRILLDLRRKEDGKWSVEKLILPATPADSPSTAGSEAVPAVAPDSLTIADSFLRAVLSQDFKTARTYADPVNVSDARLAGLCIIFEEGQYHLRASKPLRSMFQRPEAAGYIANVETPDGKQSAQFTLTLNQLPGGKSWSVVEINLDALLADYAKRVAGGDIYYSPLVKNPAGGDTVALYFEFDQDTINPRTRRQLEIVSSILKADPGKKINLTGHTDSLGTDIYNNQLSSRRADIVRDFLTAAGVSQDQIVTVAKGASQPRRPNVTEAGVDDPDGRRANRRTEIYLDF